MLLKTLKANIRHGSRALCVFRQTLRINASPYGRELPLCSKPGSPGGTWKFVKLRPLTREA